MDLISSILKRPVVGVEVRNSEIPPEDAQEKAERLDVICGLSVGHPADRVRKFPDPCGEVKFDPSFQRQGTGHKERAGE